MAGPARDGRPCGTEHSDGEGSAATLKRGPPASSITDTTPDLPASTPGSRRTLRVHVVRILGRAADVDARDRLTPRAVHRAPHRLLTTHRGELVRRARGAVSAAAATCRASTARSPAVQSLVDWAVSPSPQRTHCTSVPAGARAPASESTGRARRGRRHTRDRSRRGAPARRRDQAGSRQGWDRRRQRRTPRTARRGRSTQLTARRRRACRRSVARPPRSAPEPG